MVMEKKEKGCDSSTGPQGETDAGFHFPAAPALLLKGRRYKSFFDASLDMRFVVNRKGVLLEINQAGVDIFGFKSRQEMLELPSIDCLFQDPSDMDLLRKKIEGDGFVKNHQVVMRRKNGTTFVGNITANLWFEENGSVSYEGLLLDVTNWRRCLQALKEYQLQNFSLAQSEERIRQLNEQILQMLMLMSHDVRGSLVAMGATLKLLIRGRYGHMDESVSNTVKDLFSRVAQLLATAEEFISKASSMADSMEDGPQMLDLRQDIIDPVLYELAGELEKNSIVIDNLMGAIPVGRIPIHADKIWLKSVFRNLFRNAINHGGSGCRVAFGFQELGTHYRLNVYNSGTPIPEDRMEKLFTRLGRISSGALTGRSGLGIGLYLVREIIRKHGGNMWYEPRPDGSDFIFTLAKDSICRDSD